MNTGWVGTSTRSCSPIPSPVRLAIPPAHWFEATVEGGTVAIRCYEAHGGRKLTDLFEVDAEVEENLALVPPGWRWESTLLPG